LEFPGLSLVSAQQESMEINNVRGPAVILAASGMCTAGRIKHHLRHNLSDARNTILFVGYQAQNTLGRLIQEGKSPVRVFGEWHAVKAEVATIEGFSAHADQDEMVAWYDSLKGVGRGTFLVHGEEAASLALAARLQGRGREPVLVPEPDQEYALE
jgi:metallo-beta-lactamase family protein